MRCWPAESLAEDPLEVLNLLARLVDRSFVVAGPSQGAETRYRLLAGSVQQAILTMLYCMEMR